MSDLSVEYFAGRDGLRLAYRQVGTGRPLLLIHGFFSSAIMNWVRFGHASALAAAGYRVVMPDLRGHGDSAHPHEAACYPPDVLADDGFALLDHLDLTDYDLAGYSLGARTAVRMMARGAQPARAVLGGMGLAGIVGTGARGEQFRAILANPDGFERGSAEWRSAAFLKTMGTDATAMLLILDTFVDTPLSVLGRILTPTLVVTGAVDNDNGSGPDLATVLPNARYVEVPGSHMSAVTLADLSAAMVDFLGIRPGR